MVLIGASMGGTASIKVAATEPVAGVVSISALEGFRGLTMGVQQVWAPVLLLAETGDFSAASSLQQMKDSGLLLNFSTVLYGQGDSHGTDIFLGTNGPRATQKILEFLDNTTGG